MLMAISAPTAPRLRFQSAQRVRKARPFEHVECAVGGALIFVYKATPLFELQVNATASGVDSNALLCGGNADYDTGLI